MLIVSEKPESFHSIRKHDRLRETNKALFVYAGLLTGCLCVVFGCLDNVVEMELELRRKEFEQL